MLFPFLPKYFCNKIKNIKILSIFDLFVQEKILYKLVQDNNIHKFFYIYVSRA